MAAPPPPPGFPVAGFAPVPPPWTEHKAPNGAPYWFNPITNVSTYVRPTPAAAAAAPPPPPPGFPIAAAPPPQPQQPLTHAPQAQLPALHYPPLNANAHAASPPKKKEKKEKPRTKTPLGDSKWIRVVTNKGNVFYNHAETKQSVWERPEEVKDLVLELEAKEREEEVEARKKAEEEEAEVRRKEEEEEAERIKREEESRAPETNGKKRKADDSGADEDGNEGEEEEDEDEQVRGDLDLEIEGAEEGDSAVQERPASEPARQASTPAPPAKKAKLSPSPSAAASAASGGAGDAPPPPAPPKKGKKPKPKVVSSIEELADEDWQRQIAEEMAREAEQEPETAVDAAKTGAEGEPASVEVQERAAQGGLSHGQQQQQRDVDPIEAAALFSVLLSERDINPMAPFESELPKFVNDPRYHAVKTQRDRRDLFDQFCKNKIREQRAAKKRAAESGVKLDPLTAYRQLLASAVTSTRTHFSDFKRSHAKDARFREFGKTEGEREKEFKKWLRELGERKREAAERAEREFGVMLSEDGAIRSGDKWSEVKKRHASDPRYTAVNSSSLREQLFQKHLASLASGRSRPDGPPQAASSSSASAPAPKATKEDKAARAAASLRDREEKVRLEQMRAARSAERARGHLGKDEAEREFAQLLVDAVRDHNARFEDVAPGLSSDPRFDAPSLNPSDKRRLFDAHQQKLYRSRVADVEALFAAHSPTLVTPFEQVLPSISSDPHVTRLVGTDFDQLELMYASWISRRTRQAREDFTQMLKENSILEHWGRMKKMEKREAGKLIGEEGVREESEDEEPDAREMAEQIDLKAIHAVLRNDKRYLEFNHVPEDREKWVEEYVNNLAAPKTTVHQRE